MNTELVTPAESAIINCASSTITAAVLHPLDTLKTMMQLSGQSAAHVIKTVVKSEGASAFLSGIDAAALRQMIFGTVRMSVNNYVFQKTRGLPTMKRKMISGVVSGIAGGFVGNPFDIVMTNIANDRRLPPNDPRKKNYKNFFDASKRLFSSGVGFGRGLSATIPRAIFLTVSQTTIPPILSSLLGRRNAATNLLSFVLTGVASSALTLPFDTIRARMQLYRLPTTRTAAGVVLGAADVPTKSPEFFSTAFDIIRTDGVLGLWKGFKPYTIRSIGQTVLLLSLNEKLVNIAVAIKYGHH